MEIFSLMATFSCLSATPYIGRAEQGAGFKIWPGSYTKTAFLAIQRTGE
jgi:hypothetical protein